MNKYLATALLVASTWSIPSASAAPQNQSWSSWTTKIYRNRAVQIRSPSFGSGKCLSRSLLVGAGGHITRATCGANPYNNYYENNRQAWIFRWRLSGESLPSWWPLQPSTQEIAVESYNLGEYPYSSVPCGSAQQVCGYYNHAQGVDGYCMNMPNASKSSGTDAQMYYCGGYSNERHENYWFASGGTQRMLWHDSALCWNQEPDPSAKFQQWACQNPPTANEIFEFRYWKCDIVGATCSAGDQAACCSGLCLAGTCT